MKGTPDHPTPDTSTVQGEYLAKTASLRKMRGNKLWALSLALLKAQSVRAPGDLTPSVPLALPVQIEHGPGIGLLAGGMCFSEAESTQDYENWVLLNSCAGAHSHEACLCMWILLLACVPELNSGYANANRVWGQKLMLSRPDLISSELADLERNEAREYVRHYAVVAPFFQWFKSVGVSLQEIAAVLSGDVAMRLAYTMDVAEGSDCPDGAREVLVEAARAHTEFASKMWELI